MAYEVRLSVQAERDLEGIYSYILNKFYSEDAAKQTTQNIIYGLRQLEIFPLSGFSVENRTGRTVPNTQDYRGIILGNHIAFYDVKEQFNIVEVDRFLHMKQNWLEILHKK